MSWLIEMAAGWFGVSRSVFEQGLFNALLIGFLFATVHLLTMLVTRWGDHHATSKSFLFSLLIHLMCGLGVVTFAPEPIRKMLDPEEVSEQEIVLEGVRQTRLDRAGNTPVWEQLPKSLPPEFERMDREMTELVKLQAPERDINKPTDFDLNIEERKFVESFAASLPERTRIAEEGMKKWAASSKEFDNDLLNDRPVADVVEEQQSIKRVAVTRDVESDLDVQRMNRGGAERVTPQVKIVDRMRSTVASLDPESRMIRPEKDDRLVERRQQAQPVEFDLDDSVGTTSETIEVSESQRVPKRQRMALPSPRRSSQQDTGETVRRRSETNPQLPDVQLDRQVASIDSTSVRASTDIDLPNAVRPNFDAKRKSDVASIPIAYRLRQMEQRDEYIKQNGGTDASQRAVEASLKWFASIQTPEGYWDGVPYGAGLVKFDENGIDRMNAGRDAQVGLTALVVLTFLGNNQTHENGDYTDQVKLALEWLISQQREDGYFGAKASRYAAIYCHGMATYAIAEAYAMAADKARFPELRTALEKAVQYTLKVQNESDGGWRYVPGQPNGGDMSIFGWQLMSLKSAEMGGLKIPDDARDAMIKFLIRMSKGKQQGLASYRISEQPNPVMTAEALFCKQMLGITREHPSCLEAVEYLMENAPRPSEENLYYWYYGTMSMYQYGGDSWEQWNENVRGQLERSQVTEGPYAGSWEPRGPWGPYGGRIYSTALATLTLEVYYRYLPLYRMGGEEQKQ